MNICSLRQVSRFHLFQSPSILAASYPNIEMKGRAIAEGDETVRGGIRPSHSEISSHTMRRRLLSFGPIGSCWIWLGRGCTQQSVDD